MRHSTFPAVETKEERVHKFGNVVDAEIIHATV
jgi:hypothetical protein